jgi:hypothetical protein
VRSEVIMQLFDAIQDVGITFFLLCIHSLAEKFPAIRIQNNAFNLRTAKVYADAKHFSIFSLDFHFY